MLLSIASAPVVAEASAPASFGYGLALGAGMAVFGFLALKWASVKSQKIFMGVLFGGFVLRVAIVGVALFLVWKFSALDLTVFAATLVGSYLIFQIAETYILQRHFKRLKSIKNS